MQNKLFKKGIILAIVGLFFGMNAASSTISSDGTTLYLGGDGLENYSRIHDAIDNASLIEFKPSAGLTPNTVVNDHSMPMASLPYNYKMWGYIVNSSVFDEGTCYVDVEDPSDITYLHNTESDDFLSGGTGVNGNWIACENSTGALWEIDPDTGDMIYIGGGGVGLNGLAMDYTTDFLYGASGSGLWLIDPANGDQEYIGDFGSGVNEMIGIASDMNGVMYGWDLGDSLWTIDTETGEAIEVGPLGIDLNYAQDGCFDYDGGVLFLTAYIGSPYNGSYLCACDLETGESFVGDQFKGNSQITASVIYLGGFCSSNDIGVKDIIGPKDGYAGEDLDIIVQVRNYGNNSENNVMVNVVISKNGVDEEYNETVYFDIPWDETLDVEMPSWTPDDWQSVSNEYINYTVAASVHLYGDDNPNNDDKEKWIELYFGYFHDVGCIGITAPKSGPAQTFQLNASIKNFGQYDECCFKTYVEIAEIDFDSADLLLFEDFSPYYYFPPTGWTRTTTKWNGSSNNYCQQGDGGEARFYYSPSETGKFRLYTGPIDTTGYGAVSVEFVHYLNHYKDPYNLMIETSQDGNNWTPIWILENPDDIFTPEWIQVTAGDNVGGPNFYVSITFDGYSWNTNWWHVDSFSLWGVHVKESEYTDEMCIQEIVPGEEMLLEFDDWTPEFLAEEISNSKIYSVKSWTDMDDPLDENTDNDLFSKYIILDFFHDVGVKEIISLYEKDSGSYNNWWYIAQSSIFARWCPWTAEIEYLPPAGMVNPPQGGTFVEDEWWICDFAGNIYTYDIETYNTTFIGNSGTGGLVCLAYNFKDKKLYGMSTSTFYEIDQETGKGTRIGSLGISGGMISCAANSEGVMYSYDRGFGTALTYTINLETGLASIVGPTGVYLNYGQDMAYDFQTDKMYTGAFSYYTFQWELHWVNLETGNFIKVGTVPGGKQINCFAIPYPILLPVRYVSLGYHDIEVIVENIGTFPELDLTCYAEIYEFFTNCTNGILVYEDNITDIDLDEPLGGNKILNFDSYNFATEGLYGLFLNIPDDDDDYPDNNEFILGIGADDTPPVSNHSLYPEIPDGENGWYISDVEVTLFAEDPSIGCDIDGSGVREIKYTINGVGDTLSGSVGTFPITKDGNDIVVEYWAIDMVGNVESKNSFTIDMDQTNPVIDPDGVHWKAFKENPLSNIWYVRFWTNATDATSGMDRVEMYINEGLIEINANPDGNLYEFVIMWSTVLEKVTFSWRHYDRAGWYFDDEIQGDEPFYKSYSSETRKSNQKQVTLLKNLIMKRG